MSDVTRAWPGAIGAITLFVEGLDEAERFYVEVFDLPVVLEDDDSAVFRFGDTLVNLLRTRAAQADLRWRNVPSPPATATATTTTVWSV